MMLLLIVALLIAGAVLGGAGMRRLGRWTGQAAGRWRASAGLGAVVLTLIGLFLSVRGSWILGLPIVACGVGAALLARRRSAMTGAPRSRMSLADARAMLGVGKDATPADIHAAFLRQMKRAHPDQGGTSGLAAQLNAARDALLD